MQVIVTDDLDGSQADETVKFGIDGKDFEIDLSNANAKKLRKAFETYVAAARKASTRTSARSPRGGGPKRHDQGAVREWARGQGMKVSDRGRIPADVLRQYEEAH
jgi:hypothetical protein